MKKEYEKPQIYIERFELAQHIASCDYDSNGTQNDKGCTFTGDAGFGEMKIFLSNGPCEVVAESYCYHNASSGMFGIFNS